MEPDQYDIRRAIEILRFLLQIEDVEIMHSSIEAVVEVLEEHLE